MSLSSVHPSPHPLSREREITGPCNLQLTSFFHICMQGMLCKCYYWRKESCSQEIRSLLWGGKVHSRIVARSATGRYCEPYIYIHSTSKQHAAFKSILMYLFEKEWIFKIVFFLHVFRKKIRPIYFSSWYES